MEKVSVDISVWKRYETYGLQITPSLASACHCFSHQNFPVKIALPTRSKQSDCGKEDAPITCRSYRTRGNRKYPKSYRVNQVDATIETGISRSIRKEALGIVNTGLFNKRDRKSLDRLTHLKEAILDSAFIHWVNILRWCTEQPTICQLSHKRQASHWNSYLIDSASKKRFYCPPFVIRVELDKPIQKRMEQGASHT